MRELRELQVIFNPKSPDILEELSELVVRADGLFEGRFSNWHYKLPKDRRLQLFDFYMLTGLPTPNTQELEIALEDAKEIVIKSMKKEMMNAIYFAISAEFRHIFDSNRAELIIRFYKKMGMEEFIREYAKRYKAGEFFDDETLGKIAHDLKDNERGYVDSLKALEGAMKGTRVSRDKFMESAVNAFNKLRWQSNYGGNSWARIASAWRLINNAKKLNDMMIYIDHAYDLQHNTGTIFTKLQSYYDKGYSWLRVALDKKARIKELFELYRDVSPQLRPFVPAVIKSATGQTLEAFLRKKGMPLEKPSYQIPSGSVSDTKVTKLLLGLNSAQRIELQAKMRDRILFLIQTDEVEAGMTSKGINKLNDEIIIHMLRGEHKKALDVIRKGGTGFGYNQALDFFNWIKDAIVEVPVGEIKLSKKQVSKVVLEMVEVTRFLFKKGAIKGLNIPGGTYVTEDAFYRIFLEVIELLKAHKKITAIKFIREEFKAGLLAAKTYVDEVLETYGVWTDQFPKQSLMKVSALKPSFVTTEKVKFPEKFVKKTIETMILHYLIRDKVIGAIKFVRLNSTFMLEYKEAKEYVDDAMDIIKLVSSAEYPR